ncbi:MAG TPA: hypothetical protein VLX58_01505 [Bryobacteraceae bacterium]|nr:hypothetical protein [Bryobacteraceae bacterium]
MAEIHIDKSAVALWSGATGDIKVNADIPSLHDPLPAKATAIVDSKFDVNDQISLESADNITLGIGAQTAFKLAPLWKEETGAGADLVAEFGLTPDLTAENLMLAMDLGGKADFSIAGSYPYNVLSVGGELDAGADARLVYTRTYPRTQPADEMLKDFFTRLILPGSITAPPPAGQVTSLEFGGYLKFGVNAAAGYQIKGSPSIQLSQIALSEHYDLSVTGKLSLDVGLAGQFSVEVRRVDDHWVAVKVCRKRSKDLQIAADLQIGAEVDPQGLPESGEEFVESLLGLRAKNWINLALNLVSYAGNLHAPPDLENKLDGLAQIYISRFVNKAVSTLSPAEVTDLVGRLQRVVASYNNLDPSAIALFDRYFDTAATDLSAILQDLQSVTSWDQFKGEINPKVWNVVQQLTGGDPLTWILGRIPGTAKPSLPEFQKRISDAINLIQSAAHEEIRSFIAVAKKEFGLDAFISDLDKIDSPNKLKTGLTDISQHIVERLIGNAVGGLQGSPLTQAFQTVMAFLGAIKKKADGFYAQFEEYVKKAATHSFSLDINAAYQRADERGALIDLDVRLVNDDGSPCMQGQKFIKSAGIGDFSETLTTYDPNVVRFREGSLTHNFSSSKGTTINIAGWHNNFFYSDMHKVVVNAGQQFRPAASGLLNVFTTADMSAEHNKQRKTSKAEQEMHSNFMLRFLAETSAAPGAKFDKAHQQYLLDVITGQAATYTLTLTTSSTTPAQLQDALAFAEYLGLDRQGANKTALQPVLTLTNGSYGPIEADYSVRFSDNGLQKLFQSAVNPADIRNILRAIVVANYIHHPTLSSAGWLYTSDKVRQLASNPNFIAAETILSGAGPVDMTSPIPRIAPPPTFENSQPVRAAVALLFGIERRLMDAFQQLENSVKAPTTLHDLENRLNGFGAALNEFDADAALGSTAVSPAFAVFDGLIRLSTPAEQARNSALSLKAGAQKPQHLLLFQLRAQQAAAAGQEGG